MGLKSEAAGRGICGVDEAGRGPVIGPLVVAGVLVSDDSELSKIGVRDSKALSAKHRESMDAQIRKVARIGISVIPADLVDSWRGEDSLNNIEAGEFARIIRELRPARAFVDAADVDAGRFGRKVKELAGGRTEIVSEHEADSKHPVVSAASIIAKVRRDAEVATIAEDLAELEPTFPPLGSGYPSDQVTITFIRTWIRERGMVPPHARKTWKTVKRLLAEAETRKLSEW